MICEKTIVRDELRRGQASKTLIKKKNQHVTAYETYTITSIADLKQKAAVPGEGSSMGSRGEADLDWAGSPHPER